MLKLFLFGTPRCQQDGRAVHLPRRKCLGLLAYLALSHEPHSREALASRLYLPPYGNQPGRAAELLHLILTHPAAEAHVRERAKEFMAEFNLPASQTSTDLWQTAESLLAEGDSS